MQNQLISGNTIRVMVGNMSFMVPQEKAQQLVSLLQSWQSVAIPENQNSSNINFSDFFFISCRLVFKFSTVLPL